MRPQFEDLRWLRPAVVRQEGLGFTLLFHRDINRIGKVVAFHDDWTPLRECAPCGACPSARVAGDGALITSSGERVRIDGVAITERLISSAELAKGVIVEIGDEAVLFMHRFCERRHVAPRFDMVGESAIMESLRDQIGWASTVSVPVLLQGESGTGKELAARAIAERGIVTGRPFLAVNLAGIPPSIAASELFGYFAGAFTGAVGSQSGYFARADGGTLFLDEIGATSLEVQAMLLRTLETGEIHPLGSSRARPVNVRIISATDEDLQQAIRQGRFRSALYHRLAGYEIKLPALRERRDDIGRLIVHFLRKELALLGASELLHEVGPGKWLSAFVVARLARYDWPGNVRELANVARKLAILAANASTSDSELLLPNEPQRNAEAMPPHSAQARRPPSSIGEEELQAALRASRWNMVEAARQLAISRTSLYALLEASNRFRKAKDISEAELRESYRRLDGRVDAMAEALEVSARGIRLRLRELSI